MSLFVQGRQTQPLKGLPLKPSCFVIVRRLLLQPVSLKMSRQAPDGLITVNEVKWLWQFLNLHKAVHASADTMKTSQTSLEWHVLKDGSFQRAEPMSDVLSFLVVCVISWVFPLPLFLDWTLKERGIKTASHMLSRNVCFYTNKKKENHQISRRLEDTWWWCCHLTETTETIKLSMVQNPVFNI